MFEIRTDISTLTVQEREDLAGLILTFGRPREDRVQLRLPLVADLTTETEYVGRDDFSADFTALAKKTLDEPDPSTMFGLTITEVPAPPPPGPVLVPSPPIAAPTANASAITQSSEGSVTTATPGVDTRGLPWDERIHASTKAVSADGSWRKKRGVDDALVITVENQLRQLKPAAAPAPPPPPPSPTIHAAPPPPPSAPEAPAADPRKAYIELMQVCSAGGASQKITLDEITAICVKHGATNLQILATLMHLLPAVAAEITATIASR